MDDERVAKRLRRWFPVTRHWTYLYNGSIHPCPVPVGAAMRRYLAEWERGGEAAYFAAAEAGDRLRREFAKLINTSERNVLVTESTTAGINLAAQILAPRRDRNVVVSDLEFMSNTYPWLASRSAVDDVRFVRGQDGRIRLEDVAAAIDGATALVNLCLVTVGSGFRHDLGALSSLCRSRGVPLSVDAAQALGVIPVDVQAAPVDFLAATASKWLMGPAGVGFLYVADRYLDAVPPAVGWCAAANVPDWDVRTCVLHGDARRFQGGIPNLVGVVGALAALELGGEIGRSFIESRIRELTTRLRDGLERLGADLWTPKPWEERAGIVFFRCPGVPELHRRLKAERIYCGSFLGGIRADPGVYTTRAEIDRFLDVVGQHLRGAGDGKRARGAVPGRGQRRVSARP